MATRTREQETKSQDGTPSNGPQFYIPSAKTIHLNMAVFSVPGVGKTTLAASASTVPDMSPVAILSAESGMEALVEDVYDTDGTKIVDRNNLRVTDFRDFVNLRKLYEYFAFEKHGFKTLVFDTLDEVLSQSVAKWDRYYVPRTADDLPLDRGEDSKMGLKVYNRVTREMSEILRDFRDLPMNVIFTAHETDRPLEQGGSNRIRMELTPAFYGFVEGALSVIGRLAYEMPTKDKEDEDEPEAIRVIRFSSPTGRVRVKDRTPGQRMGKGIASPTMAKLWARRTGQADGRD